MCGVRCTMCSTTNNDQPTRVLDSLTLRLFFVTAGMVECLDAELLPAPARKQTPPSTIPTAHSAQEFGGHMNHPLVFSSFLPSHLPAFLFSFLFLSFFFFFQSGGERELWLFGVLGA